MTPQAGDETGAGGPAKGDTRRSGLEAVGRSQTMKETQLDPLQTASIGRSALVGIFWSLATNWGSRLATFILFVVLARFLTPEQYGLVSAANVVLMIIPLVAEFGFGDAVVQRPHLKPEQINLPFYLSTAVSLIVSFAAAMFAQTIEQRLGTPGLAPVVVWLSGTAPIMTIAAFQEAMYRRNLAFKALAYRAFIGNLVAGPVAVVAAYMGAGIWSLVLLNYLNIVAGMIWLWAYPQWLPSRRLDLPSFFGMARFGLPIVTMRVVDFITLRLIDYIILHRFGIAVFGIYTVGSRLYQILIQLLQAGLSNVALSVLSRISSETERMADIYVRAITISGLIGSPVFVFSAATSSELCSFLFGTRWVGVDVISTPLLLLGAIQCVQFLNGQYLSARGKPQIVLYIALFKYFFTVLGLLLIDAGDARSLVVVFSLLQLTATPLTFGAVAHNLRIAPMRLFRTLLVIALCNGAGYAAVSLARPHVLSLIERGLAPSPELFAVFGIVGLWLVFVVVFLAAAFLFGFSELKMIMSFAQKALGPRRPAVANQGE